MGRRVDDYPSYTHLKEYSGCSGRLWSTTTDWICTAVEQTSL